MLPSFQNSIKLVTGKISSFAVNFRSCWAHSNKQNRGVFTREKGSPLLSPGNMQFPSLAPGARVYSLPFPHYSFSRMCLGVCSIAFFLKTCLSVVRIYNRMEPRYPGYPANCPLPYPHTSRLTSRKKAAPWIRSVGGANIQHGNRFLLL